ncbi:myb-like DNA binding protein, putative [Babesia ovis]|uniref:Myb-like DNA binding protein, putative n=1 Tax=Babesia ovis TaxID=5869 RepID=A0A9W5TBB9_BABOV|nr:myb-like DNA binding protein, putative [Babesia ovis]
MAPRKTELDGYRVGPFSTEEETILRQAVEDYIGKRHGNDREEALKQLIAQRGRMPSDAVTLGREVLPERHPRSVYNFIRRRIIPHKFGRWDPVEIYVLLRYYFNNEATLNSDSDKKRSWKAVSRQINRLPEQIYDKWKEICPHIEAYRPLFMDPYLTTDEIVEYIGQLSGTRADTQLVTQGDSSTTQLRASMDDEMCLNVHRYIYRLFKQGHIPQPVVYNIPWIQVNERFPQYSQSHIRLKWTQHIYPVVLKHTVEGFSKLVVARAAIYIVRKKRLATDRLSHIEFIEWFPQLPQLYITSCIRSLLKKCVKRLQGNRLKHADVYYKKINIFEISADSVGNSVGTARDTVEPDIQRDFCDGPTVDHDIDGTQDYPAITQDVLPEVSSDDGNIVLTLKRQIKLAYHELQVRRHHRSDMEILSRISQSSIPQLDNINQ